MDLCAEEDECPICLEEMNRLYMVKLRCGHEFHRECIKTFLKHKGLTICPYCRQEILPCDADKKLLVEGVLFKIGLHEKKVSFKPEEQLVQFKLFVSTVMPCMQNDIRWIALFNEGDKKLSLWIRSRMQNLVDREYFERMDEGFEWVA